MPHTIENYMAPDQSAKSDKPESNSQPLQSASTQTPDTAAPDSTVPGHHRHHSIAHRSGGSGKQKSRNSKKRNVYPSNRMSLWSRLSAPVLQCRRCGERYRVSWTKDSRCPKCGRHPAKVQTWESALYTLFFPAALIGSYIHYGRSPRNASHVFGMGLAGLVVETVIYFLAK